MCILPFTLHALLYQYVCITQCLTTGKKYTPASNLVLYRHKPPSHKLFSFCKFLVRDDISPSISEVHLCHRWHIWLMSFHQIGIHSAKEHQVLRPSPSSSPSPSPSPSPPHLSLVGALNGLLVTLALTFPRSQLALFGIIPVPTPLAVLAFIACDFMALGDETSRIDRAGHLVSQYLRHHLPPPSLSPSPPL